MPSLRALLVMYGMDHAITDEVIHHLAERPSLLRLGFQKLIRQELARTLVDSIPHPFEYLQILTCSAEGRAFKLLAPHLLDLRTLRLSLVENMDTILSAIAQCPKVTHIEVEYPTGTVPPRSEVVHLVEKHRNLTTLELHWQNDDDILSSDPDPHSISDAEMEMIASLILSIEKLVLWIPLSPTLSSKSLESVGKHCKRLKYLKLPGVFSLLDLPKCSSLFPGLLELTVRDVDDESAESVDSLRSHAPKLEEFEAVQNDEFTDVVMNPITYPAC